MNLQHPCLPAAESANPAAVGPPEFAAAWASAEDSEWTGNKTCNKASIPSSAYADEPSAVL